MPSPTAHARIENLADRRAADRKRPPRVIEVDLTWHATGFGGLSPIPGWPSIDRERFEAVERIILGHVGTIEVAALPDDTPPQSGSIVLTLLDLVIDPGTGCLTRNPARGGEHMMEMD